MRGTDTYNRMKQSHHSWDDVKCTLMAELIDQVERVADGVEKHNTIFENYSDYKIRRQK